MQSQWDMTCTDLVLILVWFCLQFMFYLLVSLCFRSNCCTEHIIDLNKKSLHFSHFIVQDVPSEKAQCISRLHMPDELCLREIKRLTVGQVNSSVRNGILNHFSLLSFSLILLIYFILLSLLFCFLCVFYFLITLWSFVCFHLQWFRKYFPILIVLV